MKHRLLLLFFTAFCIASGVAQAPGAEILSHDSWIYDSLRYISVESGLTTLGVNAPASYNEIRVYLSAIPYDSLSDAGKQAYRKIQDALGPTQPMVSSGSARFDVKPVVSVNARYQQNNDASFDFDAIHQFNETKPFLTLPFNFGFTPYVAASMEVTIGEGFWSSSLLDNYSSLPTSADSIDMNIPSNAYLSTGNSFFTAVIGRGSLFSGKTLSGSMMLSDNADRLDYASLVLFSRGFRISLTPIELAPDRYVYFHDVSFRPFPFLSICFSEAATVHSGVDLRYLNPLMIYHNFAGWNDEYGTGSASPVGTQFAASFELVPVKGFRLYGQYVMNQFQTRYELNTSGDDAARIPNSIGGLAGAEIVHPLKNGYLIATLEGVYTNPWLYILSNKGISYYWSRKELVAPSGYTTEPIQGWLGSPFGPDTIAAIARIEYDEIQKSTFAIEYRFICKGENAENFLSYPENLTVSPTDTYYPSFGATAHPHTPSGPVRFQNCLTVSGSCYVLEELEISSKLGYSLMSGSLDASSFNATCTVTWYIR